ncbi:hypothetical protein PCE1_000788 [Barthelona sp. PCE]
MDNQHFLKILVLLLFSQFVLVQTNSNDVSPVFKVLMQLPNEAGLRLYDSVFSSRWGSQATNLPSEYLPAYTSQLSQQRYVFPALLWILSSIIFFIVCIFLCCRYKNPHKQTKKLNQKIREVQQSNGKPFKKHCLNCSYYCFIFFGIYFFILCSSYLFSGFTLIEDPEFYNYVNEIEDRVNTFGDSILSNITTVLDNHQSDRSVIDDLLQASNTVCSISGENKLVDIITDMEVTMEQLNNTVATIVEHLTEVEEFVSNLDIVNTTISLNQFPDHNFSYFINGSVGSSVAMIHNIVHNSSISDFFKFSQATYLALNKSKSFSNDLSSTNTIQLTSESSKLTVDILFLLVVIIFIFFIGTMTTSRRSIKKYNMDITTTSITILKSSLCVYSVIIIMIFAFYLGYNDWSRGPVIFKDLPQNATNFNDFYKFKDSLLLNQGNISDDWIFDDIHAVPTVTPPDTYPDLQFTSERSINATDLRNLLFATSDLPSQIEVLYQTKVVEERFALNAHSFSFDEDCFSSEERSNTLHVIQNAPIPFADKDDALSRFYVGVRHNDALDVYLDSKNILLGRIARATHAFGEFYSYLQASNKLDEYITSNITNMQVLVDEISSANYDSLSDSLEQVRTFYTDSISGRQLPFIDYREFSKLNSIILSTGFANSFFVLFLFMLISLIVFYINFFKFAQYKFIKFRMHAMSQGTISNTLSSMSVVPISNRIRRIDTMGSSNFVSQRSQQQRVFLF